MAPHDGGAAPTLDGRLPDILAVDGGNSKVDIALVRADGAVLGVARGAGTPLMPGTEERSLAALVDAVARACSLPVTFGVITADTMEQAMARAGGGVGNKGYEAAVAALEMADVLERIP